MKHLKGLKAVNLNPEKAFVFFVPLGEKSLIFTGGDSCEIRQ